MPAIFLSESDVNELLDMRLVIDAVEEAFRRLAAGEASNVPRVRATAPGIVLHTMSAACPYLHLVGWKSYTTTKQGAKFLVGLHDAASGELLALIEANRLGQLRTGAATAVAAEWLAPPDASELGLFGTGWQAESQLEAIVRVRPIKRAFVYGRREEQRTAFADRMSERLEIEVIAVDRPQEAAEDLPIVVTATNSAEPVLSGEWLAEEVLAVRDRLELAQPAELDVAAIRRADNVVCDSVEGCRSEAGDFTAALEKGIFDWSRAVNLCDVVAGKSVGRNTRDSVVLFKSVGMAIEDVAVGGALALARKKGIGVPLPL